MLASPEVGERLLDSLLRTGGFFCVLVVKQVPALHACSAFRVRNPKMRKIDLMTKMYRSGHERVVPLSMYVCVRYLFCPVCAFRARLLFFPETIRLMAFPRRMENPTRLDDMDSGLAR